MLFGKVRIQLPSHFPKPIFTDDLYQHSVELLTDIEKAIPQHSLTNEIRRSVEIKLDRDASFVTDLLNHLGMVHMCHVIFFDFFKYILSLLGYRFMVGFIKTFN
jgi:hypothetical protein